MLEDGRVPRANLLGEEGGGFAIAQARLGPGRIHHRMRAIRAAERALELMCARAKERIAFGRPLAEQGIVREWIADSRMEIDQARLICLHAAWLMDTVGNRVAHQQIAAIKVAAPGAAVRVIDRAIQLYGGAGVSQDFALAERNGWGVPLRAVDVAELGWQQAYVEHDEVAIEEWADVHAVATYAGFYVDQRNGGIDKDEKESRGCLVSARRRSCFRLKPRRGTGPSVGVDARVLAGS